MIFDVNVAKRNAHCACEFLHPFPDDCEPIQAIGHKERPGRPLSDRVSHGFTLLNFKLCSCHKPFMIYSKSSWSSRNRQLKAYEKLAVIAPKLPGAVVK